MYFRQLNSLIVLVVFSTIAMQAQTYNYAWMKGSSLGSSAIYGTMGVAGTAVNPGSNNEGVTWTDAAGDLWLYGGQGTPNAGFDYVSDLWKYTISTNNWTWMGGPGTLTQAAVYGTLGIPNSANTPGARGGSASWVDASGDLWLYGGYNANGSYNDMWRYTISTGMWTWMGGSTLTNQLPVYGPVTVATASAWPRGSRNLVSWKDPTGNFWMYDPLYGYEVWRYSPLTNQWAWMSGASTNTVISGTYMSVYGTLGVSSTTVHPGERYTEGTSDAAGNLYVFGGEVYTATSFGRANDLWMYNITTNQWTWISGTQSTSSMGSYGTLGQYASSNVPPGRYGHVMWADWLNNRILIFGGEISSTASTLWLNDTWSFDLTSSQWAWIKGSNSTFNFSTPGPGDVPGIQTIAASANTPGWKVGSNYWRTTNNSMWLYSGLTWNTSTELWRLSACSINYTTGISSSQATVCPGNTATLSLIGTAASYSWNNGASTSSIVVSPSVSTVYSIVTTASNCEAYASFTLPVYNLSVSLLNTNSPLCSGTSVSLSASSCDSYTWSSGQNSQTIVGLPTVSTIYTVSATQNNCVLTKTIAVVISQNPVLTITPNNTIFCSGQFFTLNVSGAQSYNWNNGQTNASIVVNPLSTTVYSVTGLAANGCSGNSQYTIVVTPNPTLFLASNSPSVCAGNTVQLTASGANSYSWSTGQTSTAITATPLVSGNYSVTGYLNGCSSSAVASIYVQPLPQLSISSSSSLICSGQTVALNALGAASYSWSSGQTTSSILASPISNTVFSVMGYSNTCMSQLNYTLPVIPLPTLTITTNKNDLCAGETSTLQVSGAASYAWIGMGTSTLVTVTPLQTTTYSVVGTAVTTCSNSASITLLVNPCTIVETNSASKPILFYPNPSNGQITISEAQHGVMRCYSVQGRLIVEQLLNGGTETVNLNLAKGLYYLVFDNELVVHKLIIN